MSDPHPRKLVLAVRDDALRDRLRRLLRGTDVDVEAEGVSAEDTEADVVVLSAGTLERHAELLAGAEEDDAPGVLVMGDDEAPHDEVRMVASGATAVLDGSGERKALAEQLVELVEAQVEGGIDGPEGSGAETEPKLADFHSRSPRMRDFLDVVRRVAASDSTLLVSGETGVGKERLARAIHAESARAGGPFVAVNCGALAESLLESELFGHEKGSFTGATSDRKGYFQLADGGTIFLDEIGEMPPHLQVKLLTVLQRYEVQPVGASEAVSVDVRVIAATNRDLSADVAEGRFREDLYFRLNVVSLEIPPLRERREDLPWFVGRFLRHFAAAHERTGVRRIAPEAMEAMLAYEWPGNVRELVNVIERAVLLCEADRVRHADLPESLRAGGATPIPEVQRAAEEFVDLPLADARRRVLEGFERRYLEHHLRETGGTVGEVAQRAGINPRTLYEKMRRLGLRKEDYR